MADKKIISFIALGCAKNRINTEIMMQTLRAAGYEITGNIENSDVCVINTCGFIEDAKTEAIENIFEAVDLKNENKIGKIIVCGCLPQRYPDGIEDELYECDGFVGVGSFGRIAEAVERVLNGEKVVMFDDLKDVQIEGERFVITPFFATDIKIAEGCNNRCAYCAIPSIRGNFRSRPIENIVAEAKTLAKDGAKELTVIAQDTTNYGTDIYGKRALPDLLRELVKVDGIEWIRLMYLYPEKIDDELLDVMASEDKILKYVEMPIQHASGSVLRRMHRPGDSESLLALVKKIRKKMPDVILRTTVMVGFPGETEEEFSELCEFLKKAKFDKLGVFAFSAEEGTPAYDMDGQVDDDIKSRRADAVETLQSRIVEHKQNATVGKTFRVLCEGYDRYAECFYGRSRMEAPEIDGKIYFTSEKVVSSGEFVNVKITEALDFELIGETVE